MNMSSFFGAACPKCSKRMRRAIVRDRFHCAFCGTALESNRTRARLIMAGISLVALPFVLSAATPIAKAIFGVDADFADKQLVAFFLIVALIVIAYPFLLSLTIAEPKGKQPKHGRSD